MSSDLSSGPRLSACRYLLALSVLIGSTGQGFAGAESLPGIEPIFTPQFTPGSGVTDVPLTESQSRSFRSGGSGGAAGSGMDLADLMGGGRTIAPVIDASAAFCKSLPVAYQGSCMADQLATISQSLPEDEGFDDMRTVLNEASRKIDTVVMSNRNRAEPRINATSGTDPRIASSRPLVAVQEEAVESVNAQTAMILEEAGDLLLRSTSRSRELSDQYLAVSQALDSSALLLRSRPGSALSPRVVSP